MGIPVAYRHPRTVSGSDEHSIRFDRFPKFVLRRSGRKSPNRRSPSIETPHGCAKGDEINAAEYQEEDCELAEPADSHHPDAKRSAHPRSIKASKRSLAFMSPISANPCLTGQFDL
jgi:hypothetical protein